MSFIVNLQFQFKLNIVIEDFKQLSDEIDMLTLTYHIVRSIHIITESILCYLKTNQ